MDQLEKKRRSMTTNSVPMACHLCGTVFHDKASLGFHYEIHQYNEPNTQCQNIVQSENKRRSVDTNSKPVACRVCDKVFCDNVSLVFHFESHLGNEIPNLGQYQSTFASLQHGRPLSLNSSEAASSEKRESVTHSNKIPRMVDYSRLRSFSVCTSKAPKLPLREVSPVQGLVLNSVPPFSLSFDARRKSPQSSLYSTESHKTTTSSLGYPFFNSLLDACKIDCGLATVPSNKQNSEEKCYIKQLEKPYKKIIIISDDEDDDHKSNAEMVDLTLKL